MIYKRESELEKAINAIILDAENKKRRAEATAQQH